ncbi:BQ5605_C002g01118 [Microbotryum silenes-dioicae]|uniref:BQ5605_C002g01118 protein n=1 Tax=Microbotryum silenes-dioicae TaxID=796604 RepID=A0A2X0P122_9BASI|nr:BQ5605_C002g01118 [Microbotryum silenes-dioicae]
MIRPRPTINTRFSPFVVLLVLWCSWCLLGVQGSALTTTILANERSCFYALVDKPGEKVGFYFAVQSGGSFDIDWTVTDPADTIMIEGERERQGDYIFTAHLIGEYSFCFSNDMSSFSEKLVDFDIMVESEPRPVAPAKPTGLTEQTSSLEESIYKLSGSLSSIQRTQKHFRTRENRNASHHGVSTVKSTQWRIWACSITESLMMVGMSAFQVWGTSIFGLDSGFFSGSPRERADTRISCLVVRSRATLLLRPFEAATSLKLGYDDTVFEHIRNVPCYSIHPGSFCPKVSTIVKRNFIF